MNRRRFVGWLMALPFLSRLRLPEPRVQFVTDEILEDCQATPPVDWQAVYLTQTKTGIYHMSR